MVSFILFLSDVLKVVQEDKLLRVYACQEVEKLGSRIRSSDINNVRTRVRHIARMILQLRINSGESLDLFSFIAPTYYEFFVATERELSAISSQMGLSLGIFTKELAYIKIAKCIEESCPADREKAEDFLKLFKASWKKPVSSGIGKTHRLEKMEKDTCLPLDADLAKFSSYLNREIPLAKNLQNLKTLVMSRLILFNKRRPIEVHSLTVEDFKRAASKKNAEQENRILSKLPSAEQDIAKR